ncbi:hypothetical protein WKG94_20160 [Pantoea agglomerans]|uniref:hypothetical protein n=1 Tax=Enterobacter agglomerans TaxID=549 RepID=UPI000E21865E|nr:hypothetical protein [Pantoea agglomerans]
MNASRAASAAIPKLNPFAVNAVKYFKHKGYTYKLSAEIKLAYSYLASLHNKLGYIKITPETLNMRLGLCPSGIDGATVLNDLIELGVIHKRSKRRQDGGLDRWYTMMPFSSYVLSDEETARVSAYMEELSPDTLFKTTLKPIEDYAPKIKPLDLFEEWGM